MPVTPEEKTISFLMHASDVGTPGKSSILARHTDHKPENGEVRLPTHRAFISGCQLGPHAYLMEF